MKRVLLVAFALLLGLAALGSSAAGNPEAAKDPAAASYIVVFKHGVQSTPTAARGLATAHGGRVTFVYQHALEGFAARLSPAAAASIANDSRVAYVEPDQVMHATARRAPRRGGSTGSTSAICR